MCLLHEGAADKSRAGGRRWRREEKYHHLGKGAEGLVRHGAAGRARAAVTLSDTQHAALLSLQSCVLGAPRRKCDWGRTVKASV